MSFKKSLKICMATHEMKVSDIADQLGVTIQAVYFYNTRDVRMSTVVKVANLFGMKVSEFLALGEGGQTND